MKSEQSLFAKVADGIWIGNAAITTDPLFFQVNSIDSIIRLDRRGDYPIDDVFEFALPDQELMDSEVPKVVTKLETICDTIKEIRDNRRSILIQCADGKNKAALVAGYYLSRRGGQNAVQIVDALSVIYFSAEQKQEDLRDKVRLEKFQQGEPIEPATADDLVRQEARRVLRALTNRSFQKILRTLTKK